MNVLKIRVQQLRMLVVALATPSSHASACVVAYMCTHTGTKCAIPSKQMACQGVTRFQVHFAFPHTMP